MSGWYPKLRLYKIGTLSPVLGFWVHLNGLALLLEFRRIHRWFGRRLRTFERLGFKKGLSMRRNHQMPHWPPAPLPAKGVAMVQLPNGGFEVVSFDPRTLQIKR